VSDPTVLVLDDDELLHRAAADLVCDLVERKPDASLVAATGQSPIGLYAELAVRRRSSSLDPSRLRVFQLDEYVGVGPNDRRSLFGWMSRALLAPLGIPADHVVRLPIEGDLEAGCAAYERAVREAGGYDLAILGIGENGHVGFNEPPADPRSPTRQVELAAESLRSNARYWGNLHDVPARAVTVGMELLLGAAKTLLIVTGKRKHEIVHRALEEPIGSNVPASFLRESADLTVLSDRDAWGDGEIPGAGAD
jgi:glucosamine-6-phosphate deaminase